MPSRGSYQVANTEEGKAAQRDQSYRSCVLALLIFFFLCIILILAALPWKKSYHYSEKPVEDLGVTQHQRHHEHYTGRTTTMESVKHHQTNSTSSKSVTSEFEVFTEKSNAMDTSSSRNSSSERFINTAITTDQELLTSTHGEQLYEDPSTINTNSLLENFTSSTENDIQLDITTEEYSRKSINKSKIYTTQSSIPTDLNFVSEITSDEYTTYESTTEDEGTIADNSLGTTAFLNQHEIITDINESTAEDEDTTTESSLSTTVSVNKYETMADINESTTEDEEDTTIESSLSTTVSVNKYETTVDINESTTEDEAITETVSFDNNEITTDSIVQSTTKNKEETSVESTTDNPQIITTYSTSTIPKRSITTASTYRPKRDVCTSGECKNIASKMLFYMNHTADPCEDFYEYACGGFEANPQVVDQNLENVAYQRILRQMQKEIDKGGESLFVKYYNSCIQYENINQTERIRLARRALDEIGKFYTSDDEARNHANFTELVAKLLLHNSALLFNVAPDLDEYSLEYLTLKIGPAIYRSPFDTEKTKDSCHANQYNEEDQEVDMEKLYKEYKTCKDDTRKFLASISEALTALDVFSELNNSHSIIQYINATVIQIDMEIVKAFFANFPSKEKIHEAYLMRNYTRISVTDLQRDSKIVNWTSLFYSLVKTKVGPDTHVQVYFYDALVQGLKSLEGVREKSPMQLNNALLGLYAHDLYRELVLSKHENLEEHCLRVAANILIPEASNLYISSFSSDELSNMNRTIHRLFEKLKETLMLRVKEADWVAEEGHVALQAKINNLKVVVPDVSYFTDEKSTYKQVKADQVVLSDNYFNNSMILISRYRMLMNKEFCTNPGDPEQIWTQYATPYQSKGLAMYRLNLVVIPFGAIDSSFMYDEFSFDYMLLASLGTIIAHQIAHHFDANGIYYWNGTREAENSLLNDNDSMNSNFKEYIDCQRNILYQDPRTMELPSTGQLVSYQIMQLTLNERLSETMGLRLAYDTLNRLRSPTEDSLPWLELNFDQLFYLTYAQMYCTKSPLTSSYVKLYEDEQLPSRIRIFVSASNNRLLGEAWKCPEGSQIIPSSTCSIFPYLESKDETGVTMSRK
ncbi:endothelin-converting enzyme homolog [Calliopsis andreniformis]|uniref:endothelin-converting enzyme homolog n=1 Tax=Calliopsis andreniformis TaxID=337506 RepID=UPI003FCD888E